MNAGSQSSSGDELPGRGDRERPRFVVAKQGLRIVLSDEGGSFSIIEVKMGRLVLKTITAELSGRSFDSIATVEQAVARALAI